MLSGLSYREYYVSWFGDCLFALECKPSLPTKVGTIQR